MSETTKLLKGIMRMSGWTQEQVAAKLGVSYPTMNAWINGKAKPRQAMLEKVRRLYLAQDLTDGIEPTFVTLVNVPRRLKVGDMVVLEKDLNNSYDDEAIAATIIDVDVDEITIDDEDGEDVEDERMAEMDADLEDEDEDGENEAESVEAIRVWDTSGTDYLEIDDMYVANSVNTVVRGTSSAGRIYDKFGIKARARVIFIFHKTAIVRVLEWDYAG